MELDKIKVGFAPGAFAGEIVHVCCLDEITD